MDGNKETQSVEFDNLSDEELLKLALKPLADPVVIAMFTYEDAAGLAAQSLVNAVLEIDGDPPMGKIIRLTTQKTTPNILSRGYRLDIEGITEKELSDTEIQLTPMNMVNRSFLEPQFPASRAACRYQREAWGYYARSIEQDAAYPDDQFELVRGTPETS